MNPQRSVGDSGFAQDRVGTLLVAMFGVVVYLLIIGSALMTAHGEVQEKPTAEFEFDYNNAEDVLTITYTGGDSVRRDQVSIVVLSDSLGVDYVLGREVEIEPAGSGASFQKTGTVDWYDLQRGESRELASGESVAVTGTVDELSGSVVRVYWSREVQDASASDRVMLAEYTIPDDK